MLNKVTEAIGKILYLYGIAKHEDPSKELYGEITSSEKLMMGNFGFIKGLFGIKDALESITDDNPKSLLEYLCSPDIMMQHDPKKANLVIPVKTIRKDIVKPVVDLNERLDPEELRLAKGITMVEGHITPKNQDNFYEVIRDFTQNRKLYLLIRGQNKALAWYVEELNKAGFHTCSLHTNLKEGKHTIKDQNEKERPNMVIWAPYCYSPDEIKTIKGNFEELDKQGSKMSRMAINVMEKDLPKDFNVTAVLHEGATMPALIETISDLYNRFYLREQNE